MLRVLIAIYELCNVFMIRNQIQNLYFPLYILNILLQSSMSPHIDTPVLLLSRPVSFDVSPSQLPFKDLSLTPWCSDLEV